MWKQLNIADGRYYIDETGRLYNIATNRELHPYLGNNGYYKVDLKYNGERIRFLLHRLVAQEFCPNPNNYPIVLHLDSNPRNCHYTNLKWGTYSENNKQAVSEGHMIVPRPDNRKYYELYNENSPVKVICSGVKDIISKIGFGTDSRIRNYIFRNQEIPYGKFKGWKIKLKR